MARPKGSPIKESIVQKERIQSYNRDEEVTPEDIIKLHIRALKESKRRPSLMNRLQELPATPIDQLLKRDTYVDKIEFQIHRDYCEEPVRLTQSFPNQQNPHFKMRTQGAYLRISIMGEILAHDGDYLTQALRVLHWIYEWIGIVPVEKWGINYWGSRVNKYTKQNYPTPEDVCPEGLWQFWLKQVKLKEVEVCFPIGEGDPNFFFVTKHFIRPKNPEYVCFYSDDYTVIGKKKHKSTIRVYDCSGKEELDHRHTKLEITLRGVSLPFKKSLKGNCDDIILNNETFFFESMRMVHPRKGVHILNCTFLRLWHLRAGGLTQRQKIEKRSYIRYIKNVKKRCEKDGVAFTADLVVQVSQKGKYKRRGKYAKKWSVAETVRLITVEL